MPAKLRLAVALAWTVLIFGLCWTPRTMMPVAEDPQSWLRFPSLDKIVHCALFAGFSFFWGWANVRAWWVVAAGLLATLMTELGQQTAWVNRDATWGDGLADALGVALGLVFLAFVQRWLTPNEVRASPRTPSAGTL